MARTGVSLMPIVPTTVASAPSQWVALITSGPEMPGKRYFAPPEKPTTSCGKVGPRITM